MNSRPLLAFTALILFFNVSMLPVRSQTLTKCTEHEEIFGFQVPNYATQLQKGAILNIKVAYRLTPEAIAQNKYPDFVPIRKEIDQFLVNYPHQGDFWEIVNKSLVQFLLDKYPQMSSLRLELDVSPTPKEPFPRFSIVQSTRANGCPLSL